MTPEVVVGVIFWVAFFALVAIVERSIVSAVVLFAATVAGFALLAYMSTLN